MTALGRINYISVLILTKFYGVCNIKIDKDSKKQFRDANGISHCRRIVDAVVDEPVCRF